MASKGQRVKLVDAAMQLGMDYQEAYRFMLAGHLDGQRDGKNASRWTVSQKAIDKVKADRAKDTNS